MKNGKILLKYLLKIWWLFMRHKGREKCFSEIYKPFLFFRGVGKQICSVCGY